MTPKQLIEIGKEIKLSACGIYLIYCSANDKAYVGHTKDAQGFKGRFSKHKNCLNRGKHQNIHLQGAWNLYGSENFIWAPIFEIDRKEPVSKFDEIETSYMKLLDPQLFNFIKNSITKEPSEETKVKISLAQKERAKKFINPMKGKKHSPEVVQGMKERNKGEGNPMFGRKHTESAKKRMRGIPSDITRLKSSEANRRKKATTYLKKQNLEVTEEKIQELLLTKFKPGTFITVELVRILRKEFAEGKTTTQLAKKYNIDWKAARAIVLNQAWKDLSVVKKDK